MGAAMDIVKGFREPIIPEDIDSVDKAVAHLITQPDKMQILPQTYLALRTVQRHILKRGLTSVNLEGQLYLNRVLLALLSTGKFKNIINKLYQHWLEVNQKTHQKKIVLIKVAEINYLEALASFLILMSDDRILFTLSTLHNGKFDEMTTALLEKFPIPPKTEDSEVQPIISFIERQTEQQCESSYVNLKDTLQGLLHLKTSFLTRSYSTVGILSMLAQHTFIILTRLFFHPKHYPSMRQFVLKSHSQLAVRSGAYFLATAVEGRKLGLYNLSVKFLTSILYDGQSSKQIVSFPSHMFLNVPLLTRNNVYQFVLWNLLQGLARVTKKNQDGEKTTIVATNYMDINRYETWRLVLYLLENDQAQLGAISCAMIEDLCRTVRVTDLERVYLNRMVRFALKVKPTEVLEKFAQTEKIEYQLNFANSSVKLTSNQIYGYLEKYLEFLPSQVGYDSERYMYESMFRQQVKPLWTEAHLWDTIKFKLNNPKYTSQEQKKSAVATQGDVQKPVDLSKRKLLEYHSETFTIE